ncbi:MAG: hypothetical protein WBN81_00770 [Gammaproteobacteria bacterium]
MLIVDDHVAARGLLREGFVVIEAENDKQVTKGRSGLPIRA